MLLKGKEHLNNDAEQTEACAPCSAPVLTKKVNCDQTDSKTDAAQRDGSMNYDKNQRRSKNTWLNLSLSVRKKIIRGALRELVAQV